MRRYIGTYFLVLAMAYLMGLGVLRAQEITKPGSQQPLVSGQLGLVTEWTGSTDYYLSNPIYRRPGFLQRMTASLQFRLWKFTIPVNLSASLPLRASDFSSPSPQSLKDYLLGKGNRLGFAPTLKKLKVPLGSHTVQLSPLVAGNVPFVMGAGVSYEPMLLTLRASYGITQRAIKADSIAGVRGGYAREMLAVKVGLGSERNSLVAVQYLRARDVVRTPLAGRSPVDGAVGSVIGQLKLFKRFTFRAEMALSAFASSTLATPADTFLGLLLEQYPQLERVSFLVPLNSSMRVDGAADAIVSWKGKHLELGTAAQYKGAGFQSLAFANQARDYLDLKGFAKLRLFQNALQLDATGGWRETGRSYVPGLSSGNTSKSGNLLVDVRGNLRLSRHISLNAQCRNFGYAERNGSDSVMVQMDSENYGGGLEIAFDTNGRVTMSLQGGSDEVLNMNAETGENALVQSQYGSLQFQASDRKKRSLMVGLNAFANQNEVYGATEQVNAYAGLRLSLFKSQLQWSARVQVSKNTLGRPSASNEVTQAIGLQTSGSLRLGKHWTGSLQATARNQVVNAKLRSGAVWIGTVRIGVNYLLGK